jgi:hypothetical protein
MWKTDDEVPTDKLMNPDKGNGYCGEVLDCENVPSYICDYSPFCQMKDDKC